MPELPEIQAHAERLDAAFAGAPLERFTPLTFTALKTVDPRAGGAYGHELVFVGRRGKHLLLDFGELTFVVHLMQGGRLKPDDKQAAKPALRSGPVALRRRPRPAPHRGRHRAQGRRVGGRRATPRSRLRSSASDPKPTRSTRPRSPSCSRAARCDSTASSAISASSPAWAGCWPTRCATAPGCHRSPTPASSTPTTSTSSVEAIHVCINEGLAFERGLAEMSSSADRPAHVHNRVGEACPECGDVVRAVEYSRYTVAYCAVVPDRRQGPGRQHHQQVPQLGVVPPSRRRAHGQAAERRRPVDRSHQHHEVASSRVLEETC